MDISTQIKGNWDILKGKVRQKWGKLTDNDIESLKGSGEEFYGRLEKLYGITKDKAQTELHSFFDKRNSDDLSMQKDQSEQKSESYDERVRRDNNDPNAQSH